MNERTTKPYRTVVQADGTVIVPPVVAAKLGLVPGQQVNVRVSGVRLDAALKRRGVTAEELEKIADRQFENAADVGVFLAAEGSLAGRSSFRERVARWLR